MTNVAGLGGTNVTFALSNSTAGAFSVEYTTNLSNWFLLGPATRAIFSRTPTRPPCRNVTIAALAVTQTVQVAITTNPIEPP